MSLLQKEFRRLQFPQVVSLLYLVPEGVGALSTEIIHIDGTDRSGCEFRRQHHQGTM